MAAELQGRKFSKLLEDVFLLWHLCLALAADEMHRARLILHLRTQPLLKESLLNILLAYLAFHASEYIPGSFIKLFEK